MALVTARRFLVSVRLSPLFLTEPLLPLLTLDAAERLPLLRDACCGRLSDGHKRETVGARGAQPNGGWIRLMGSASETSPAFGLKGTFCRIISYSDILCRSRSDRTTATIFFEFVSFVIVSRIRIPERTVEIFFIL